MPTLFVQLSNTTACDIFEEQKKRKKKLHLVLPIHENNPAFLLKLKYIFTENIVHYLGFYINKRLTWNPHTQLKRNEINGRYKFLLGQLYILSNIFGRP